MKPSHRGASGIILAEMWLGLEFVTSSAHAAPDPVVAMRIGSCQPASVSTSISRLESKSKQQRLDFPKRFDLRPTDLTVMLNDYSRMSDIQVLFDFHVIEGLMGCPVRGTFTVNEAITRLLQGTNLVFDYVNDHTMAVTPRRLSLFERLFRKARPSERQAPQRGDELDEILISGANRTGSLVPPLGVHEFSADLINIEQSGASTAQGAIRTFPQVFGGGPTEDTILGREAASNGMHGSGVNVRGFDAGATVVLVNGWRIAPGGASAGWADISNIPLSAIDRIELLPDGAGALYGADAIGGVINFKLRNSFEGLQTQARLSSVTDGPVKERLVSQLAGHAWEGGRGLLSLEYHDKDALFASDRVQATSDLRVFGGTNFDSMNGNPGTLLSGGQTYAIPRGQNGTELTAASLTPGTHNETDLWQGTTILPAERRISALGAIRQALGDRTTLFVDALGAQRKVFSASASFASALSVPPSNPFLPTGLEGPVTVLYNFARDLGNLDTRASATTGNLHTGIDWEIGGDWTLRASAGYSAERDHVTVRGFANPSALAVALADPNPATAFNPFADGSATNPETLARIASSPRYDSDSRLKLLQIRGGGSVLPLPAGNAKVTAGFDFRDQSFNAAALQSNSTVAIVPELRRHVVAAFGELRVPVFGVDHRLTGFDRLELSAALRHERYSDVGSATTPQFGVSWTPVAALSFRGTWAELFRAPNLPDRVENNNVSALMRLPDPSAIGQYEQVLLWGGNNASLAAERGNSWTLGLDLNRLDALPSLSFGVTYFSTRSYGRVVDRELPSDALTNPLYHTWLIPTPTRMQQAAVCDNSNYRGTGSCLDVPISAILDLRLHNAGTLISRGFDFNAEYEVSKVPGTLMLGLLATDLLQYSRADYRGGPLLNLLSTLSQPIDFRLRGSASWAYRRVGIVGFLNYQNSYRQFLTDASHTISSWTTVDLNLSYSFKEAGHQSGGTQVAVNVENLLDRSAPFVNNSGAAIGYDQENGDLLGRFVSLSIKYEW